MKHFQIITDDLQIILQPGFSRMQLVLFLLLLAVFGLIALYMGIASVPMVGRL